jgi:hypothetical protein
MIHRRFIAAVFFSGLFGLLQAQTGLLVSPEKYQKIPLLPTYSGTKYTEVPVKVSLKKYCPVPGDQGRSGACVGWAIGYGALTIQRAVHHNITDQSLITQQANSAAFIYNQVRLNKTDCQEGAYLEDALALLKSKGDCLEKSFNYEKVDCHAQPEAQHLAEAAPYAIRDYATIFDLNEDPKSKIGKACKILATQTPLVVGIGVTKSFFEILPGATRWNPDETETIDGHHALVMTGYNSVEKYFEFLNSFGASWGQNGFIRISFDDFERLCRFAYVIVPSFAAEHDFVFAENKKQTATNPQHVLSGTFVFRQPAGFVSNEAGEEFMYFEEVKTRQFTPTSPGFYVTERAAFQVGDVFQLVAREIPKGCYVYVFSQSPDGVLNLHFPRKKEAVATAGFVLEKTMEVVIPGEESLLQLPMPGDDYLCILYSQAPIPQFDHRFETLAASTADFPIKVYQVFSELLIQSPHLQFTPDNMSFSAIAQPAKNQIAVAIILKVRAE